jgi:hypothetical protein
MTKILGMNVNSPKMCNICYQWMELANEVGIFANTSVTVSVPLSKAAFYLFVYLFMVLGFELRAFAC